MAGAKPVASSNIQTMTDLSALEWVDRGISLQSMSTLPTPVWPGIEIETDFVCQHNRRMVSRAPKTGKNLPKTPCDRATPIFLPSSHEYSG
jgi:hypothetical protein